MCCLLVVAQFGSTDAAEACVIPDSGPWPACATDGHQDPKIYQIWTTPSPARPGEPVTLHWRTNTDYVILGYRSGKGHKVYCGAANDPITPPPCPANGSVELPHPDLPPLNFIAVMNDGRAVGRDYQVKCGADAWFFQPAPERCPSGRPNSALMQIQYFQKGVMIGSVGSQVHILLKENQAVAWAEWREDAPEDSHPTLQAPSGLYKPSAEFSAVWSLESLGWAVEPTPRRYDGYVQSCCATGYSGTSYLSTPSQLVYRISGAFSSFSWSAFQSSLPVGEPCVIPASGPWPACAK